MKKGLTELVFIIDRSVSMECWAGITIGEFNAMLKRQAAEGEALVTTVLFDDQYELLHNRIDIKAVAPLTDKDYTFRGSTALHDAIGKTINKIRTAHEHTAEDFRPEEVLFVIFTDGSENASREYSLERIKTLIERQREKYGWRFTFIEGHMCLSEEHMLRINTYRTVCSDGAEDADGFDLSAPIYSGTMVSIGTAEPIDEYFKSLATNDPFSIIYNNVEQIFQRFYLGNNPSTPIDETNQYLMDCRNCGCVVNENGKIMGDPSNDPQLVYRDGKNILIKDATSEELTYYMGALRARICRY
jgi:hypothetical protein